MPESRADVMEAAEEALTLARAGAAAIAVVVILADGTATSFYAALGENVPALLDAVDDMADEIVDECETFVQAPADKPS